MKKIARYLQRLDRAARTVSTLLIRGYQFTLSPDKGILTRHRLRGRVCAHTPHCSEYARLAFERYPFFKALWMSIERVSQCSGGSTRTYDPVAYSVVFCSSAPIGEPFLEALVTDERFTVTGVVTMPDVEAGRGMNLQENTIKVLTKKLIAKKAVSFAEHDIQTPPSLNRTSKKYAAEANAFFERLVDKSPDFLVVIAYGKIIPQEMLDIPSKWPINVHGSLLPKYRWASPLQSVFLHNEKTSGVTIMRMNDKMDEGAMIAKKSVKLPFERTVADLIERIKKEGPTFLNNTLREYGKWRLDDEQQKETDATYCRKIEKEDGLIDPLNDTLKATYAKYRAFALRPKLHFLLDGKRIIIEKLRLLEHAYADNAESPLLFRDGEAWFMNPAVSELLVKPEGKKSMAWEEFVRGRKSN